MTCRTPALHALWPAAIAAIACSGPATAPPAASPAPASADAPVPADLGTPWTAIGFPPPAPWDAGAASTPWNGKAPNDLWVVYGAETAAITPEKARDAWRDTAVAHGWTVEREGSDGGGAYAVLSRSGGRLRVRGTTGGAGVMVVLGYEAKRVVDAAWPKAAWCPDDARPDPSLPSGPHACFQVGTEMVREGDYAEWAPGADPAGPPSVAGRYANGERVGEWTLAPVVDDDRTYAVHASYAADGTSRETYTRADGTIAAVFDVPSHRKDAPGGRTWTWTAPDGRETGHETLDATGLSGTVGRSLPTPVIDVGLEDLLEVLDVNVGAGLVAYRVKVVPYSEGDWQDCEYPGVPAPYAGVTLGVVDLAHGTNEKFDIYVPAATIDSCTRPEAATAALGAAKARFAALGLSTTALPSPIAPAPSAGARYGYEGKQVLTVGARVAELSWRRDNYDTAAFVENMDDQVGSAIGGGAVFATWTWDGAAQDRFIEGYGRSNGGAGQIAWWGAFADPAGGAPLLGLRYDELPYRSVYAFVRPPAP